MLQSHKRSIAALLLGVGGVIATSSVQAAEVDPSLAAKLADGLQMRVLVLFDAPDSQAMHASEADARHVAELERRAEAVLARLPADGWRLRHRYYRLPWLALEIDAKSLDALRAAPGVLRVGTDPGGAGSMAQSAPLATVTDVFAAGLDGSGAKVAVVDSGIDTDHADFAGRIVGQQCFCSGSAGAAGCCPNGADSMSGPGAAEDDHGHGTNVSGIAVGGGSVALRGSAPAAQIVAVKVLDSDNGFCCSSDVAAAFDWVRQNHPDTEVLNASLGTSALFGGVCDASAGFTQLLATAVSNLVDNGTMVFVSTGNQGSPSQISAPSCVSDALGVGAVWDASLGSQTFLGCTQTTAVDLPTCFTNSSSQVALYAPGAYVTSSGSGGGTTTFGGTSQATPLAAGCAAALRAEFPQATLAEVGAALRASPVRVTDPKNGLQFPRLDCADAALRLSTPIFADGFES